MCGSVHTVQRQTPTQFYVNLSVYVSVSVLVSEMITIKRMHSSRMRTGHSLTVCCRLLPGGVSPWQGGVLPGRGVWSREGVLPGRGGILPGGGDFPGRGGSPWQGGGCSPYWRPPPVNRMTNRCKNITLATTSLRPVKRRWDGQRVAVKSENHVKEIISIEVMKISSRVFSVAGGCGPGDEKSRAVDQGWLRASFTAGSL